MDTNFLVRILKVELKNFKNVRNGEIKFMNYSNVENDAEIKDVDLLGIYGQNGSGKTAMIEALDILQHILSGEEISFSNFEGLLDEENLTRITTYFYINGKEGYKVKYEVNLRKNTVDKKIEIDEETLTSWTKGAKWKSEKSIRFQNPFYSIDEMLKNNIADIITKPTTYKKDLSFVSVIQNLSVYCAQKNISIFFNKLMMETFKETEKETILCDILDKMSTFAHGYFHVVKVNQLGLINNSDVIPINFHQEKQGIISNGCLPLFMNGHGTISENIYEHLEAAIKSINMALKAIVPNLHIELERISEEVDQEGIKTIKVDVYSVRNGKKFLTKYESEGIKRIISLLNYLISAYNYPGICLVIDELDAGIFEYLLGDLLGVLFEGAKGQLIFTSHNLRVLERLSMKNIVCSTTNPDNRYIVLTGVDTNNNHRDFYIRALALGGQKEELYDSQDLQSIEYAFRSAGLKKSKISLDFSDAVNKLLQESDAGGGACNA